MQQQVTVILPPLRKSRLRPWLTTKLFTRTTTPCFLRSKRSRVLRSSPQPRSCFAQELPHHIRQGLLLSAIGALRLGAVDFLYQPELQAVDRSLEPRRESRPPVPGRGRRGKRFAERVLKLLRKVAEDFFFCDCSKKKAVGEGRLLRSEPCLRLVFKKRQLGLFPSGTCLTIAVYPAKNNCCYLNRLKLSCFTYDESSLRVFIRGLTFPAQTVAKWQCVCKVSCVPEVEKSLSHGRSGTQEIPQSLSCKCSHYRLLRL